MKAGATNEKGRGAGIFHLIVRILTLPPIVIGITVLLMYVPANLLTLRELLLCELFLLLIPMAAYPIREIFHIGKDRRKGQRSTALVCSAIGYICGFLWSMLTPCSWLVHILFLSYVICCCTAPHIDRMMANEKYFICENQTYIKYPAKSKQA